METYKKADSTPQHMTLQVKAICDHMLAAGKKELENALQELENAIKCHTHWHIRFAERPLICGCDFPQIVPTTSTGELELRYHLPDGNEPLVHFINQIAILTVLTTETEENIYLLNPDTAMDMFHNENQKYGRLVREVTTTLTDIIIVE